MNMSGCPLNDMRSEQDIFQERISTDLVAFGNFSAYDITTHSINPEEFENIEPGLFEAQNKKS